MKRIAIVVLSIFVAAPGATQTIGPPAKAGTTLLVPEGTAIPLVLMHGVSAKSARVGDRVILSVPRGVRSNGIDVIAAGTEVIGRVSRVERPGGRVGGMVAIDAEEVLPRTGGRILLAGTLVREGDEGRPLLSQNTVSVPFGRRAQPANLEAGMVFVVRTTREYRR